MIVSIGPMLLHRCIMRDRTYSRSFARTGHQTWSALLCPVRWEKCNFRNGATLWVHWRVQPLGMRSSRKQHVIMHCVINLSISEEEWACSLWENMMLQFDFLVRHLCPTPIRSERRGCIKQRFTNSPQDEYETWIYPSTCGGEKKMNAQHFLDFLDGTGGSSHVRTGWLQEYINGKWKYAPSGNPGTYSSVPIIVRKEVNQADDEGVRTGLRPDLEA